MSSDPYDIFNHTDHRSASVIQVETSKLVPLIVVVGMLAAAGFAGTLIGYSMLRDRVVNAEVETRLLESYVAKQDAILMQYGIKQSGDDYAKFKRDTQR